MMVPPGGRTPAANKSHAAEYENICPILIAVHYLLTLFIDSGTASQSMKRLSQKVMVTTLVIITDIFDPASQLQASGHKDKKWTRLIHDRSHSVVCESEHRHAMDRRRDGYAEKKNPISQYANDVTALSKDLRQETNREKILKIAIQITEQAKELACAAPKDLSLLANGFSKLKVKSRQVLTKALLAISDEIIKRQTRLTDAHGCRVQTLALLANAFSGVCGCEPGLKILHDEVVKREAQLSAAQGCPVQNLALLANGFSGVSGCEQGC